MARQQQLGTRYAAGQSPVASIWDDTKQWREENLLGDIATSFIPGIAQAGAVQDAQTDFGQGNYGMGTLAALGAVPGLGAITKPIRAGIKGADTLSPQLLKQYEQANEFRRRMKDEYNQDVLFTQTNPRSFKTPQESDKYWQGRTQQAGDGDLGPGIYAHDGSDAYHQRYGGQLNAMVMNPDTKGPMRQVLPTVKGTDDSHQYIINNPNQLEASGKIDDIWNDYF